MRVRASATLLAVTAALGCRSSPDATPSTSATVAVDAGHLRSTEWLAAHLDDPSVVVLHVDRERSSYEAGHVPGAGFVSLDRLLTTKDGVPNQLVPLDVARRVFEEAGVSDDRTVVLYGGAGGLAPARAFLTLDVLGLGRRAFLLDGGLEAWRRGGRPLSRDSVAARRGAIRAEPEPWRVVDATWLRARLDDNDVAILDARPPAQFRGDEPGEDIPRPGHVPGARSLYWESLFDDPETRRLVDRATLRARFEAAGAAPSDVVVVYCRTGMQSAFLYFVARHLGYETRKYDGSFHDWSHRREMPVARE